MQPDRRTARTAARQPQPCAVRWPHTFPQVSRGLLLKSPPGPSPSRAPPACGPQEPQTPGAGGGRGRGQKGPLCVGQLCLGRRSRARSGPGAPLPTPLRGPADGETEAHPLPRRPGASPPLQHQQLPTLPPPTRHALPFWARRRAQLWTAEALNPASERVKRTARAGSAPRPMLPSPPLCSGPTRCTPRAGQEQAVPALTTAPVHTGLNKMSSVRPDLRRLQDSPPTGEGHRQPPVLQSHAEPLCRGPTTEWPCWRFP